MTRSEYRYLFKSLRTLRFMVERCRKNHEVIYYRNSLNQCRPSSGLMQSTFQRKQWYATIGALQIALWGMDSGVNLQIRHSILCLIFNVWRCEISGLEDHDQRWSIMAMDRLKYAEKWGDGLGANILKINEIMDLKPAEYGRAIMLWKLGLTG